MFKQLPINNQPDISVFQAPAYHLIFEALLIIWIVKLMFAKAYAPDKTVLTEKVCLWHIYIVQNYVKELRT